MEPQQKNAGLKYPDTPRSDIADTLHGVRVPDPYRWLEEIDSDQTQAWIKSQNRLSSTYLSQIEARDEIYERLTELWNYEKYTVPFIKAGRVFFTQNDGLQDQNVLYWTESLDAEPRVLLNPNRLSEDGTVALTGYSVSEDGKLLAYGLSTAGSDWQEWWVREVDTGRDLDDHLKWVKFTTAAWTKDNKGFFYSRFDEPKEGETYKGANYYHKLYYHRIGTPQSEDVLIYERPDHKDWNFGAGVTEDGRYLIIAVRQGTLRENAIFYADLHENGDVIELLPTFDAHYDFIANDGPIFYFLTDLNAPLGRVVTIDVSQSARSSWREIIPESSDVLQGVRLIHNRFVAAYLHDAQSRVRIFDETGNFLRELALPTIGTVQGFGGQLERLFPIGQRKNRETFYLFTGFTAPGTVYRYDMKTGVSTVFREPALKFDPEAYVTEQVFYPSKDDTKIPMFLCYKKGLNRNGNHPTYLYGYGGFNISLRPMFSVSSLVWMEMGGVYAQANLRGGGEYGKPWHQAGTKLNKQNVFDDFIAAAEWLIETGATSTPKLAIAGRSNGGLLIGACMTQCPNLFGACLPTVGVLDMLRFHKFTIGWAWVSDYGSPDDPEEFKVLHAYSPYHNVKPETTYPPTLIMTGDHDDRVFPAHSFKFAGALQAAQEGNAPILIRIDTKAGHGMGKPTSKLIEESVDGLAFLVQILGMNAE
jgi:prolyl oligopeptidase